MSKRISELPSAGIASESDIDAVVQSGITRKRTLTQLRTAIVGAWQGFIGAFLGAASASDARTAIGAIGVADNITGSAGKLTTVRNIAATGDVAWNVNFDGSASVTSAATVGRKVSPAYIEGLQMTWVSANALTVQTGSAYIDSLATVLPVPAAIAKTGLTLAGATKFHVYLFSNAGTPDIGIVTTAPSAKTYGNARTKTGDTSRRYIGTVYTGAANTIHRFKQSGNKIMYGGDFTATPFSVLSNGVATVSTNVSLAGCVPETAPIAQVFLWSNTANAVGLYVNDADTGAVSTVNSQVSLGLGQMLCCDLPISGGAQLLNYAYSATPGANGAYMRVQGYIFER